MSARRSLGAALVYSAFAVAGFGCTNPSGGGEESIGHDVAPVLEWAVLPGGSSDGSLNYASGGAYYPQLAFYEGQLYNTWYEDIHGTMRIRVARWDGGWRFVDGSDSTGINRVAARDAIWSRLLVHEGDLFCYWQEAIDDGRMTIRVARYTGTGTDHAWQYIDGDESLGLRIDETTSAEYASLASFDGRLYAAWRSNDGIAYQIRVSRLMGTYDDPNWMSVDPGTTGINHDPSVDAYYPKLHVHDGALYAAWYERNGFARQLRVARYNGDDIEPQWYPVDGGAERGINFDDRRGARGPQLLTHENALYAVWYERGGPGSREVRVAVYDDAAEEFPWTFVDGNIAQGLNRTSSSDGWWGRAVSFGDYLYVAWTENDSTGYRIHLSSYDSVRDEWTVLDPPGGFNRVPATIAEYPHLAATSDTIALTWTERIDGTFRVFVSAAAAVPTR